MVRSESEANGGEMHVSILLAAVYRHSILLPVDMNGKQVLLVRRKC